MQYAPDGTGHKSREDYDAYFEQHKASLEALVESRESAPNSLQSMRPVVKAGYLARREVRQGLIDDLMTDVAIAMVAYAGFTKDTADTEGSAFVRDHSILIYAHVLGGGESTAALLAKIKADQRAWLQTPMGEGGPVILSLFEAALS